MRYLATPSWIDRGVASHVSLRRCPFNSNRYANCCACLRAPISCTTKMNKFWIRQTIFAHFSWSKFYVCRKCVLVKLTCKELHVSIKLLLLFEDEHEVVPKAALHHHPINGARQIDISCQKYNVFPLEGRYRLFRILHKNIKNGGGWIFGHHMYTYDLWSKVRNRGLA